MNESEQEFDLSQLDLEALMAATASATGSEPLESVIEHCIPFVKKLEQACPVKTAAVFGGLLLKRQFHKNCLRLETLAHMAVIVGNGTRPAPPQVLIQGYHATGQACGYLEDPPEDVFVHNIHSKRGNYKVIGGIWEGAGFYLQRFVYLVDTMPDRGIFAGVANAVHALLKVSDLVCMRAGLRRYEIGEEVGESTLSAKIAAKASDLRALVTIAPTDLEAIGVDFDDLRRFVFNPSTRRTIAVQSLGNTDLERHPLAMLGDTLYLVLPTAVSLAVRWLCIKYLGTGSARASFAYNLSIEYSRLFSDTPILGGKPADFEFIHDEAGAYRCVRQMIDVGRCLNLIFVMDTLQDFAQDGFVGMYKGGEALGTVLAHNIDVMQEQGSADPDFRDGITLLVCCGVGRGVGMPLPLLPRDNWRLETISVHDLYTLSQTNQFKPLDLWRLLEAQSHLSENNVWLQNMNGLLNLYAWGDSLNGHMVPHAEMPKDVMGSTLFLAINQNGLREVRHKVALSMDEHAQQYVDGTWLALRKDGASYFEEDEQRPFYGSLNAPGRPKGAFVTAYRCWWSELASPEGGPDTQNYERWKMLGVWLVRAAPPLERAFSARLGSGPVRWKCIFEASKHDKEQTSWGSEQDATNSIALTVDHALRTIELRIGAGFDRALFNPENVAERALVRAFVEGVAILAESPAASIDMLVAEIVPNAYARHSHIFQAKKFRDHISELSERSLITISRFDDALDRLGMGWQVRNKQDGGVIEGKLECQQYLNALVSHLERELCAELRLFDRQSVITQLLLNYEVASVSRDHWHRTAAAVLALRDDQAATLKAMRDYEFKLNAIFQPTRNLLEMAICESPLEAGKPLGAFDVSRLLGKASRLYHIGGWSDLLRWGLMRPMVLIRPLGDVHVEHDFIDTVLEGYGSASSDYRYMSSVRRYAKNLEQPPVAASVADDSDARFIQAWIDEFRADLDAYRRFIDAIENLAIHQNTAFFVVRRSALIELADSPDAGEAILANLTLTPRQSWSQLPDGFDQKDIAPWRFRRRLSALRRPLLQLTIDDDPLLIVAPGLVREGFASTVGNYYSGAFPDRHLGPAMRRYAGYARHRDGMAFNTKVAERLIELGWKTQPELKLTKILRRSLDRDYGDVDVLAWNTEQKRVLIIECKDLQTRKTYGEIAEQLSDFRGEEANGKRDLLRKHLDRVGVLREQMALVGKYLELDSDFSIESVVVFSYPVPMQFSTGPIREQADLFTFDTLDQLCEVSASGK